MSLRRTQLLRQWVRHAGTNSQAPQRKAPKLSGRGRYDPETDKKEYVQEFDYTITPTSYTYTADGNIDQFERFPLVDSKILAGRNQRPTRVRMLSRDFIDDSLYNPSYGYFSKTAEIYTPKTPFKFQNLNNIDTFLDQWTKEYEKVIEGSANDPANRGKPKPKSPEPSSTANVFNSQTQSKVLTEEQAAAEKRLRQLWHTPTELFHPYYGWALARYIVKEWQKSGHEQLKIYEMGAGNGTLMTDILDYIKGHHSDIYAKTKYNVIEISPSLSVKQAATSQIHSNKIEIVNKSIFEWTKKEEDPCFFIALEVWDNFSHDVIRYDNTTNEPHQGYVVVEPNGSFTQIFSSKLDKWATRFFEVRDQFKYKSDMKLGIHPLAQPKPFRQLRNAIFPFNGNLSTEEYIPTRYLQFLHVLRDHFPNHHLLGSDFTHFTERISGYNSPVVQTFIDGTPVPISTYMAIQGYFDIMFPTDFKLAKQLYEHVCGKKATIDTHGDFLTLHRSQETVTKTGEDPMISFYRNAAFLTTKSA